MISEVDFISGCPIAGCKNNQTKCRWCHHNCGGYEKITNQGIIYCLKCKIEGLFIDWKFDCGEHDYQEASSQALGYVFSVMSQLYTKNQLFIAMLNNKVSEQFFQRLNK